MPLPRAVALANKRFTNRFIEPVVSRFRGFAEVSHRGRTSGNAYRTPVVAFDLDAPGDRVVVALTYGPGADWVRNVVAGPARIDLGHGERVIVSVGQVGRETAWPALPRTVRVALRILRVHDFLLIELEKERDRWGR